MAEYMVKDSMLRGKYMKRPESLALGADKECLNQGLLLPNTRRISYNETKKIYLLEAKTPSQIYRCLNSLIVPRRETCSEYGPQGHVLMHILVAPPPFRNREYENRRPRALRESAHRLTNLLPLYRNTCSICEMLDCSRHSSFGLARHLSQPHLECGPIHNLC
jgi:hypothetical protein